MRIYYRGYVIDGENRPDGDEGSAFCEVYGTRPERQLVAAQTDPQSAMKWIDGEVMRQPVPYRGWDYRQPTLV